MEVPLTIDNNPPVPDTVEPLDNRMVPPSPLDPTPTETEIDPPLPLELDLPVPMRILPESPKSLQFSQVDW